LHAEEARLLLGAASPTHMGAPVTLSGGIGASSIRQANLASVLGAVVDHAPISQSLLGELTGLKKPTISKLVDELHRGGWIQLSGETQGAVGRPRQLWAPAGGKGLIIAAQLSLEQISVLIVDFAGNVRAERSMAVDLRRWSEDDAVRGMASMILGALEDARLADAGQLPVLGVAIAAPGIVTDTGALSFIPGLSWDDPDLRGRLRAALGATADDQCPFVVDNEANLATLAEQHYGGHTGARNMVYVLADRGVGAGVVLDGQLFRGAHRSAGEVGHMSMNLDGPLCPCGKRGCWALYVGQDALRDHVIEARGTGGSSELWGRGEAVTSLDVVAAALRGDAVALGAVAQVRRYLAAGIGNLVNMYDPELVVLGGFMRSVFADSLDELRGEVDQWIMGGRPDDDFRLDLSVMGAAAPRWGGVRAVTRLVVANPRSGGCSATDRRDD
jgi:predicted NBD/HSP70 family sugar kinase